MKKLRCLLLQMVTVMYLFAFCSLYVQIPGLYGDRGILPARAVVKHEQPSLVRFAARFGLTVADGIDFCCILGVMLSSLGFLFRSCRTSAVYLLLFMLYLSVYEVGQTFLWFQWDILLLELGFLAIFLAEIGIVAPYLVLPPFPHSSISILLLRWLLFRLMFTSGLVKLTSQCPTWWGLTALNYHYESQCIPTPLAWYAHQLPDWFQKFSVASTFIIQIAISPFFFAPTSFLVKLSFYAQVFLQILILLTGNYNFFNLTTIVLCFSLADGAKIYHRFLAVILPRFLFSSSLKSLANLLATLIGIGAIAWIANTYFSLKFQEYMPPVISSSITFTNTMLDHFIEKSVPVSIFICGSMLFMAIFTSLVKAALCKRSMLVVLYRLCATTLYSLVAISFFAASSVPYCRGLRQPPPKVIADVRGVSLYQDITQDWNLPVFSSYGLFRSMTGVGGRPEVIVEASMSEQGPWKPYEFLYKPGSVSVAPPVVAPHQPRLDWQMWFAALSRPEHSTWLFSLIDRFFDAEPDVLALIQDAPFGTQKPGFIRANQYLYHYSSNVSGKFWWRRDHKSVFIPPVTKKQLARHVAKMRVPLSPTRQNIVNRIRSAIGQPEGFAFISFVFVSLMATRLLLGKISR